MIAAIATAALAAAPATAAAAPTVTLDRSCYAWGDPITETGAGFAPGTPITELALFSAGDGTLLGAMQASPVTTDASGAFMRRLAAPRTKGDGLRNTVHSSFVGADDAAATELASTNWTLSVWDLQVRAWKAHRARPGKPMTVRTWGWTAAGTTLYAHYARAGRVVATQRIGALTGPCGDLTATVKQFPFAKVAPGRWKVYFSATRSFSKRDDDYLDSTVVVPRQAH